MKAGSLFNRIYIWAALLLVAVNLINKKMKSNKEKKQ